MELLALIRADIGYTDLAAITDASDDRGRDSPATDELSPAVAQPRH